MKVKDILFLANAGVLVASEHCLDVDEAFVVFKFRHTVKKIVEEIKDMTNDLKEDDPIWDKLMEEEREIKVDKPLSFKSYHLLSNENRENKVVFPNNVIQVADTYRLCEDILNGILYVE